MEEIKKKKVVFMTDSSLRKTGFARHIKEILLYLHKTGKYDLVEYCCGVAWSVDPEHQRKPWKSFGALPDSQAELNAIASDDQSKRMIAYGPHNLDRLIYQEKPDVFFGIQDIWGINFSVERQWFNKITSVLWTTLDSLPILKSALDIAPKVKNYWVWSKFAEVAMKKLGHNHIKTVHGTINDKYFFKHKPEYRAKLREDNGISQDAFVIGFVFRNQPRKSVPNLMHGFKLFKQNNPEVKNAKLLLHTNFLEGWRIKELSEEYNVPFSDILTTYVCSKCRQYKVKNYENEPIKCPFCGQEKSFVTTGPGMGITEEQLNEVYNLMDIYLHCFNSGGQEIPVQEAKLTELPTLVTNYSCGEELCEDGSGSLSLDYAEYREPETQFIKASTNPYSVCKQLTKVYKMSPQERDKLGKQGRQWVLANYSIGVIGKYVENFIDFQHYAIPNVTFSPKETIDNKTWLEEVYKGVYGTCNTNSQDFLNKLSLLT